MGDASTLVGLPPHRAVLDDPAGADGRLRRGHGERLHRGRGVARHDRRPALLPGLAAAGGSREVAGRRCSAASSRPWSCWVFAIAGAAASASALPGDKLAAALVMLVLLGLAFGGDRPGDLGRHRQPRRGDRHRRGRDGGRCTWSDALANIVDGLNAIRPLSLFRYYMGGDPLRNGLNLTDAAILAAVAAVVPGPLRGPLRAARPGGVTAWPPRRSPTQVNERSPGGGRSSIPGGVDLDGCIE